LIWTWRWALWNQSRGRHTPSCV